MKKYKLIKKLPFEGSPEIGYISKPTLEKDNAHYWNHNWFHPEDYPEYWEEVVEKDFEVLSFLHNSTILSVVNNQPFKGKLLKDNLDKFTINSIKRLSDGEIFSLGDKVIISKLKHDGSFIIDEFYFDCNGEKLLCNGKFAGNGHVSINKIEKAKTPLLITEDGIEIFEHVNLFYIQDSIICSCYSDLGFYHDNRENTKFFSSKKKAEEYFLITEPCLSIKDIAPIIGECNNTTYIDLDKLTEKLKSSVISKMWKKVNGK